jgi:hypothetical protein
MTMYAEVRQTIHTHQGSKEQLDYATQTMQYAIQHPVAIVIPRGLRDWFLAVYTDSDLGKHPHAKSTMGGVFLLSGVLVHWYSRVQTTVAFSTFEAEYVALAEAVRETLALLNFLEYLDIYIASAVVYCDQQKVVESINSGKIMNSRQVRHLLIRFKHVVDHVSAGRVKMVWIRSETNCADPFTKAVSHQEIETHMATMGLKFRP